MPPLDLSQKRILTFDCYGTLIDWETGLLNALQPVFSAHRAGWPGEAVLEQFAEFEAEAERGPYLTYREVLARCLRGLGARHGFTPTVEELSRFSASVGEWPAFPDSAAALARLKQRFKLAPITNCDDDLFALSSRKLGITFDWIITAQQARSYKPSLNNFRFALEKIGAPKEQVLHLAQSLFHDHAPAQQLGWQTVWINRRAGKGGHGATPPAHARPDLEFPDLKSAAVFLCG
jgi:2-haloacid dehalogenase